MKHNKALNMNWDNNFAYKNIFAKCLLLSSWNLVYAIYGHTIYWAAQSIRIQSIIHWKHDFQKAILCLPICLKEIVLLAQIIDICFILWGCYGNLHIFKMSEIITWLIQWHYYFYDIMTKSSTFFNKNHLTAKLTISS